MSSLHRVAGPRCAPGIREFGSSTSGRWLRQDEVGDAPFAGDAGDGFEIDLGIDVVVGGGHAASATRTAIGADFRQDAQNGDQPAFELRKLLDAGRGVGPVEEEDRDIGRCRTTRVFRCDLRTASVHSGQVASITRSVDRPLSARHSSANHSPVSRPS